MSTTEFFVKRGNTGKNGASICTIFVNDLKI